MSSFDTNLGLVLVRTCVWLWYEPRFSFLWIIVRLLCPTDFSNVNLGPLFCYQPMKNITWTLVCGISMVKWFSLTFPCLPRFESESEITRLIHPINLDECEPRFNISANLNSVNTGMWTKVQPCFLDWNKIASLLALIIHSIQGNTNMSLAWCLKYRVLNANTNVCDTWNNMNYTHQSVFLA